MPRRRQLTWPATTRGADAPDPLVDGALEHRQRHRALVEHDHVELANVEALAEARLGALAQLDDLQLPIM